MMMINNLIYEFLFIIKLVPERMAQRTTVDKNNGHRYSTRDIPVLWLTKAELMDKYHKDPYFFKQSPTQFLNNYFKIKDVPEGEKWIPHYSYYKIATKAGEFMIVDNDKTPEEMEQKFMDRRRRRY
jgi:hypothetical protein